MIRGTKWVAAAAVVVGLSAVVGEAATISNFTTTLLNDQDTPVNLTTAGTTHWAAFAEDNGSDVDRKTTGVGTISNLSTVGGGNLSRAGDVRIKLSWTDGTPDAVETDRPSGAFNDAFDAVGAGLQFTITGITGAQRVEVYGFGFNSNGTLTASYGGTPVTGNVTTQQGSGHHYVRFGFDVSDVVAGDTLTIIYTMPDNKAGDFSNVGLTAVTVAPVPEPPDLGVLALAAAAPLARRRRRA